MPFEGLSFSVFKLTGMPGDSSDPLLDYSSTRGRSLPNPVMPKAASERKLLARRPPTNSRRLRAGKLGVAREKHTALRGRIRPRRSAVVPGVFCFIRGAAPKLPGSQIRSHNNCYGVNDLKCARKTKESHFWLRINHENLDRSVRDISASGERDANCFRLPRRRFITLSSVRASDAEMGRAPFLPLRRLVTALEPNSFYPTTPEFT